jgi:tetratricopeptide (TPR) repeat protein
MAQPLLSLCMIVRDEAATIERAIASARPFVDEIVVLDTGSVDGTAQRAAQLPGVRVARAEWTDDFAVARNRGLAEARGRYALVLDGDEALQPGAHPAALRALVGSAGCGRLTVEIVDRQDGQTIRRSEQVRLFPREPETRYAGAFAERLVPATAGAPVRPSGLVLSHEGRLGAERRRRARRNAELLERRLLRDPADAHSRFRLAWEQSRLSAGRALPGAWRPGALEHLEAVAGSPDAPAGPWAVEAARLRAALLLAAGRAPEALEVLDRGGDGGVACDLLRADALVGHGADADAAGRALELIRTCFDRSARDRGVFDEPDLPGPVARSRAAEVLLLLGSTQQALELAQEAAALPGGGAAPWNVLAAAQRALDRPLEASRCYLEGLRVDPLDPWAWGGIGELLLAARDAEQAVEPLRRAVAVAPGWDTAEEALASALLLAGRGEEALEIFGEPERAAGPAHAALILAGAATGHGAGLERVDPAAGGSVQRILARVAAAGRPDLLHNLALGLRAVS